MKKLLSLKAQREYLALTLCHMDSFLTPQPMINVDCFVLTKKVLRAGEIVECVPIGLMQQIEDGKEDHNVLAVIQGEDEHLDSRTREVLVEFVKHVFDHIERKTINVGMFEGREAALVYLREHELSASMQG